MAERLRSNAFAAGLGNIRLVSATWEDAAVEAHDVHHAAAGRHERSRQRKVLEKRAATLDARMAKLNEELARIDAQLANPAFFGDGSSDAVSQALRDRGRLAEDLEKVEAEWLALQVEMETGQTA